MPSTVCDGNVIKKKSCVIENEWVTGIDGEDINADFNLSLGGGSIMIDLNERYSDICLKSILSNQTPTKAVVDIDVYGDGQLLYSIKGLTTQQGEEDIWLSVGDVTTLEIVCGDNEYKWVGESVMSKHDTKCHFKLEMYEPRDLEWVK